MVVKDLLENWKSIITFVVVVSTATYSIISWAQDQQVLIEAKQQLIHNDMYQENRIAHKQLQIEQYQRELKRLLEGIGDDEPTLRESRDIEWLDEEIFRLRNEIEEIRVHLAENEH
jgi:hypothetical protein